MPRLDDSALDEVRYSPVCAHCARLLDGPARKCEAFATIPRTIWQGENKHRVPFDGDGGKTYVPKAQKV